MFKDNSNNRVDTVFVLMIFCVFAVSVFLVIILGGSTYRNMNDISQHGQSERIVLSYIRTKMRNIDDVSVGSFDGNSKLELIEVFGTRTFVTAIYLYDGWVRELFRDVDNAFDPTHGVPIIQVEWLDFEQMDNGLIFVFTDYGNMTIFPRTVSGEIGIIGYGRAAY